MDRLRRPLYQEPGVAINKLGAALIACDGLRAYGYGMKDTPQSKYLAGRYKQLFQWCEDCLSTTMLATGGKGEMPIGFNYLVAPLPSCQGCLEQVTQNQRSINEDVKKLFSPSDKKTKK